MYSRLWLSSVVIKLDGLLRSQETTWWSIHRPSGDRIIGCIHEPKSHDSNAMVCSCRSQGRHSSWTAGIHKNECDHKYRKWTRCRSSKGTRWSGRLGIESASCATNSSSEFTESRMPSVQSEIPHLPRVWFGWWLTILHGCPVQSLYAMRQYQHGSFSKFSATNMELQTSGTHPRIQLFVVLNLLIRSSILKWQDSILKLFYIAFGTHEC